MLYTIVFFIGLIFIFSRVYHTITLFLASLTSNNLRRYGNGWVLVTGATDGIGKGFCQVLAKKGFNVIVFGRNKEKADNVCKELERDYKIKSRSVIADFTQTLSKQDFVEDIKAQLKAIISNDKVSMLVNNVGMETIESQRGKSYEFLKNIVSTNVASQVLMTKLVLEEYMKKDNKDKQAIINISSITADGPVPLDADYTASKTFNDKYSQSLTFELKRDNIDVLSVKPFYVVTKLTGNFKSPVSVTPKQCAIGSLNSLGKVRATYGHIIHNIVGSIAYFIPQHIIGQQMYAYYSKVIRYFEKKRLRKEAEKQKQQ